jgi:hypothetical protein
MSEPVRRLLLLTAPAAGANLAANSVAAEEDQPGSDEEVDESIWLARFMHYDLGYFDLEQKTLQPLDNPFGTRLSPMS